MTEVIEVPLEQLGQSLGLPGIPEVERPALSRRRGAHPSRGFVVRLEHERFESRGHPALLDPVVDAERSLAVRRRDRGRDAFRVVADQNFLR
jgi:hypothetical protein